MEAIFKFCQNINHNFKLTSDMRRSSQIMPEKYFSWWWCHRWRHRVTWKLPSIFMFRRGLAPGRYKCNISSINANIVIVFLGYICLKKISMNKTFQDCRSKVMVIGLQGDLGTLTAITLSILGVSRSNKNRNVGINYSYIATATKIRFHLWFRRSLDTASGSHIRQL